MEPKLILKVNNKSKNNGFVNNIEYITEKNKDFRRVIYTANHCQLVVMSLNPKEEIGEEIHNVDQFFRIESGFGTLIMNGVESEFSDGYGLIIPAGTKHNVINIGNVPLKIYTIYSPPHHKDETIHVTKQDALNDKERFDGEVSI